jgi:histidine triad (HIT) family protein
MIDIQNYNNNNIFAKILRNEIPSKKVFENDDVYAFKDINPQAPVHVVIIPKKEFCSLNDFSSNASDKTIIAIMRSINEIADILELNDGYRIISNVGKVGGQEVPHFHIHMLGGTSLGRIIGS